MRNLLLTLSFVITFAGLATSCGEAFTDDGLIDETGLFEAGLTKAAGGSNGDLDYCDDPAAPCAAGEGDCDTISHCESGLVCAVNNGAKFGFPVQYDFCVPSHCTNGVVDGDETGLDCGGTCGTCSGTRVGENGDRDYCNDPGFPCGAGEGDCDIDDHCAVGLVCGQNNGAKYGFAASTDFCWPTHCEDGVVSGNETDVDCGGDCGICLQTGENGDNGYCEPAFPCDVGEGDCNSVSDCVSGLICGTNNGERFGFAASLDFCVGAHCQNKVLDGDETGIDCGGSCGPCLQSGSVGDTNYCDDPNFPCQLGEGNCRRSSQCALGLVCDIDAGVEWGYDAAFNVCEASHCTNGTQDGDETSADCGGSCGSCLVTRLGGQGFDAARAVAFDSTGAFYVAGIFANDIDLGDGIPISSAGERDVFVAKYSASGGLEWKRTYGGTGFDEGAAVSVTTGGDLIVSGRFTGSVSFGSDVLSSAGGIDVFILRLSSAGTELGASSFGGVGDEFVEGMALDGSGNVILTGGFVGETDLGEGPITNAGFQDIFVAKYSASGSLIWGNAYGSTGADYPGTVAVDADGDVWTTGGFFDAIDFGGGVLTSAGSADGYVLRLNSDGTFASANQFGGTGVDIGRAIVANSNGDIFFAGAFSGSVNFLGTSVVSAGARDYMLARLNSSLTVDWIATGGGAGDDEATALAVSSTGRLLVGGYYRADATIGTKAVTHSGGYDGFVTRYSPAGAFVGGTQVYSGSNDEFIEGLALRSDGLPAVVGYFRGTSTLAGVQASAVNQSDGFLSLQ